MYLIDVRKILICKQKEKCVHNAFKKRNQSPKTNKMFFESKCGKNDDRRKQNPLQKKDFTYFREKGGGGGGGVDIVKIRMSQEGKDPLLCKIFVWQVDEFYGCVVFRLVSVSGVFFTASERLSNELALHEITHVARKNSTRNTVQKQKCFKFSVFFNQKNLMLCKLNV